MRHADRSAFYDQIDENICTLLMVQLAQQYDKTSKVPEQALVKTMINFRIEMDFDNDGLLDFFGKSNFNTAGWGNTLDITAISALTTGDFNGDGCTDLVTANASDTLLYFPPPRHLPLASPCTCKPVMRIEQCTRCCDHPSPATSMTTESAIPQLSLIVPVYDEEDNLKLLHERICESLTDYSFEVIYVNDGSRDSSGQVLEELARDDKRVKVLHFVRNYGQTAALTAGIRASIAPLLVTLDADLQNDPRDIPSMMPHLEECEVVCGWRKDRQDSYLTRTFLPSWPTG